MTNEGRGDIYGQAVATLLDQVRTASVSDLPEVIGDLERLKATAYARLVAPPAAPGAPKEDRLLTIKDAAPRLSMTPVQVAERLRRREFPAVKIGRFWRIRESDISTIIDRLRIEGLRRR